jgi:uncharacterized RDD family membrane protein YckC
MITLPAERPADDAATPVVADYYAGLATRTLAFAVDAAVINVVAWFIALVIALCLSLLDIPEQVEHVLAAIGACFFLVWTVSYFTYFWSSTGQTPGNRVMRIRVEDARTGGTMPARRAFLRFWCLLLAAIPLCAGFLLILVDRRRRGMQDLLARTEVVHVPASAD